jgi:hypothetical protein
MSKTELTKKAHTINVVVSKYFESNPSVTEAKPKDLMSSLIKAGIFKSDHRQGLPLRNFLRELDKENLLHLLPMLRIERKTKNRLWYFTTGRHFG